MNTGFSGLRDAQNKCVCVGVTPHGAPTAEMPFCCDRGTVTQVFRQTRDSLSKPLRVQKKKSLQEAGAKCKPRC